MSQPYGPLILFDPDTDYNTPPEPLEFELGELPSEEEQIEIAALLDLLLWADKKASGLDLYIIGQRP